ncbi:MAG: hypothetical protein WD875_18740 [Pirellulales bacterium]
MATGDTAEAEKKQPWCSLPEPDVRDGKAKQLVLDTLNKDVMKKVDFYISGLKFGCNPESLKQVKLRVQFDDIRVYERNGTAAWAMSMMGIIDLPSDAAYFRNHDLMVIKAASNDIYHQAIIVHECTHAMLDMFGSKGSPLKVTTARSEAMAYIAQAVFAKASYAAIGFPDKAIIFEDSSDTFLQQVFDKAWEIAGKILGGSKRVDDTDLTTLLGLIPKTKTYMNKPTFIEFNGIALRPASCS